MLDGVDLGRRLVGIEPGVHVGSALTQEIPTLVEPLLQPAQAFALVVGKLLATLTLAKLMLLVR